MRHSHNTTHTFEVRFSSRQASEVTPMPGLSAIVCSDGNSRLMPSFLQRAKQVPSSTPFSLRSIIRTTSLLESALTNRACMASEVITSNSMIMMLLRKPVGRLVTITNAHLIATQSNREVTKTDVIKTPYSEAQPVWSVKKDHEVVARTNFKTPISTRMRHTAS